VNLAWLDSPSMTLPNVWLAEVRADRSGAFREQGAMTLNKADAGKQLKTVRRFGRSDFSAQNLKLLRASLKAELIEQGLYADEAEAMLETWKAGYFEKPGLRVFYVVPRAWTDYFLPLKLSVPARVNRVIIGRIDMQP
jgi:hypothetical protein